MFKKKQILAIVVTSIICFLIGTMFNVMATDNGGNPWDRVWTAITGIESRVETLEAQISGKGYISISAVQFLPQEPATYFRNFTLLQNQGGTLRYWANLQLPHGATVTNLTAFLLDQPHEFNPWIAVELCGYNLTSGTSLGALAHVETSSVGGSWEWQVHYDDTIDNALIDNENCMYGLRVFFSGTGTSLGLRGAVIEYEYKAR